MRHFGPGPDAASRWEYLLAGNPALPPSLSITPFRALNRPQNHVNNSREGGVGPYPSHTEAGHRPVKRMTRQKAAAWIAAILIVPSLISPAFAQDRRDRDRFERREHQESRERYERHFVDRDWDRWRGGRWLHGRHAGREGWWWVIGGSWYFYPAPVYPYPDPYALPVIVAPPPGPPAATITPVPAPQRTCREYQGDAIVNGSNEPFYGTACLEPDGQWHIVSR